MTLVRSIQISRLRATCHMLWAEPRQAGSREAKNPAEASTLVNLGAALRPAADGSSSSRIRSHARTNLIQLLHVAA